VQLIGLGEGAAAAISIADLKVTWPVSRMTQTFRNLKPGTFLEITEGSDTVRLLPHHPLPAPP
jgi:hypothetical protein